MAAKKVLIFDDDEDLLGIFTFLFEENGWQVHTYQSCDEVIEKTKQISPQLILMDNWIPTIGGIEATRLLKSDEYLRHIPVLYISANNDVRSLSEQAGAEAFLAKPFNFDELEALVEKLVNKTSR
jgi:CheY-like chemotaxis protein